jgi:hypothetical protein
MKCRLCDLEFKIGQNILIHLCNRKRMISSLRSCTSCGSNTTYVDRKGRSHWYDHDGWYCEKCNNKILKNLKWHPITRKRKLNFKGKQIYIGINPRKGQCSECGKRIGDLYINKWGVVDTIKTTHMHHIEYDETDPLAHTIELCSSCHVKETWLLGQYGTKFASHKTAFMQRIYGILSSI